MNYIDKILGLFSYCRVLTPDDEEMETITLDKYREYFLSVGVDLKDFSVGTIYAYEDKIDPKIHNLFQRRFIFDKIQKNHDWFCISILGINFFLLLALFSGLNVFLGLSILSLVFTLYFRRQVKSHCISYNMWKNMESIMKKGTE